MKLCAHDGILALLFAAILVALFAPAAFAAETRLTLEACRGPDCEKRVITPNGGYENLFACMAGSQIATAQWLSQTACNAIAFFDIECGCGRENDGQNPGNAGAIIKDPIQHVGAL